MTGHIVDTNKMIPCADCGKPIEHFGKRKRCVKCGHERQNRKIIRHNKARGSRSDRPAGYPKYIFLYFAQQWQQTDVQ